MSYCVSSDIMPSVNDVLCIIIIPLLDYIIYPHIENTMKLKILPLHKVHINSMWSVVIQTPLHTVQSPDFKGVGD